MIGLAIVCALPFAILAVLLITDPGKLRPPTTPPVRPVATHVDPLAGHPMHCKCYHHR